MKQKFIESINLKLYPNKVIAGQVAVEIQVVDPNDKNVIAEEIASAIDSHSSGLTHANHEDSSVIISDQEEDHDEGDHNESNHSENDHSENDYNNGGHHEVGHDDGSPGGCLLCFQWFFNIINQSFF